MSTLRQLITPNLNIEYRGGWCEKAAENTVGQNGVYGSAYKAWLANVQHKENPPKGFYVPIYLSLPNGPKDPDGTQQGDVAISCPDGTVAAAAQQGVHKPLFKYPSLKAYIDDYARNNGGATLLGWGEYIGKVQVIKGDTMDSDKADDYYIQALSEGGLGRTAAGDKNLLNNKGQPKTKVLDTFRSYPEWKDRQTKANNYDRDVKAAYEKGKAEGAGFTLVTEQLYRRDSK